MATEKTPLTEPKKRGRPAVADLAKNRTVKMTDADWEKFRAIGGMKWLRAQLHSK